MVNSKVRMVVYEQKEEQFVVKFSRHLLEIGLTLSCNCIAVELESEKQHLFFETEELAGLQFAQLQEHRNFHVKFQIPLVIQLLVLLNEEYRKLL